MATYIIIAIIAYAIGSINFSVIISKKMAGFDVREKGSGNAGSTNVLRSVGKKAAILTLICDILKGVIAVLIAVIIGKIVKDVDRAVLAQIAGILVVVGHTFPIFFGFKGGKGVATSLGVLCPVLTLFIHSNYIVEANGIKYLVFGAILAAFVIFNHRSNIQRIASGTENKLSFKNKD